MSRDGSVEGGRPCRAGAAGSAAEVPRGKEPGGQIRANRTRHEVKGGTSQGQFMV